MNLQLIIDEFEAGTLADHPDATLEAARLEVEYAANQARHLEGMKPFRQTLFAIESSLVKTLSVRYGCND